MNNEPFNFMVPVHQSVFAADFNRRDFFLVEIELDIALEGFTNRRVKTTRLVADAVESV
jgi:hypothetical protein